MNIMTPDHNSSCRELTTSGDGVSTVITCHNSYHSDCSVGDITETSISDETASERQFVSAIAATLVAQQQDISTSFSTMVSKMAFMIDEKESENERIQGKFSLESQQRRQEQAEKCSKAVNSLAKKQAKISRQLEKLVLQLEESNRQKDLERTQLKKQLSSMKERMYKMKSSLDISNSSRGINGPKNRMSRPPLPTGRNTSFRLTKTEQPLQNFGSTNEYPRDSCDEYSIPREISFVSTVVDVAEMTKRINNDETTESSSMDDLIATGECVRLFL
jgi:hypothetical protein